MHCAVTSKEEVRPDPAAIGPGLAVKKPNPAEKLLWITSRTCAGSLALVALLTGVQACWSQECTAP